MSGLEHIPACFGLRPGTLQRHFCQNQKYFIDWGKLGYVTIAPARVELHRDREL